MRSSFFQNNMQNIEKSEILFIINPKAGPKRIDRIIKSIKTNGFHFRITRDLEELEQVMSQELDNHTVFVAVGGDGTVNSLARHLTNKNEKFLAVLPTGSGNGFAKELGFISNLKNLVQHIGKSGKREVDVLTINDKEFINMAGVGLDAETAHRFHKFSKRGLFFYILSAIISYFKLRPFNATILHGDLEISGRFKMITIANTRRFGSNAFISPSSSPFDGQYEIVVLKPFSIFWVLPIVYRLFTGKLDNSRHINYYLCNNTSTIHADCNKFHSDGDPLFSDGKYEIRINKGFLNVIETS